MPKPEVENLSKGTVRLRLLREADLPMTLSWRNQDDIRRWFIHSAVIEPQQHRAWFEKYLQRNNDLVFIIEETVDLQRPVGQVALYDINWVSKKAEFGRLMVDPSAQGKGIAWQATLCLLEFGFDQLGLDEIYLEVFSDNQAARRIYVKAGFIEISTGDSLTKMSIRPMDFAKLG